MTAVYKEITEDVRVYPPRKRSVPFAKRVSTHSMTTEFHYLPLPYIMFYRHYYAEGAAQSLYATFSLTDDFEQSDCVLCMMPFHGIHNHRACLDMNYHYIFPTKRYTFDDLIAKFWSASFGGVALGLGNC